MRRALLRGLTDADSSGMLEVSYSRAAKPAHAATVDDDEDDDAVDEEEVLELDPTRLPEALRRAAPAAAVDLTEDAAKRPAQRTRRGVRRRVYDYWRARLSERPQQRLDALLEELFASGDAPPCYAAFLLLALGHSLSQPIYIWNLEFRGWERGGSLVCVCVCGL